MKFKTYDIELKYKRFPVYTDLSPETFVQNLFNCYELNFPNGHIQKEKRSDGIEHVKIVEIKTVNGRVFGGIIDSGKYPYKPPLRDVNTGEVRENPKDDNSIEPNRKFFLFRFDFENQTPIKGELVSYDALDSFKKFMKELISLCLLNSLFFLDKEGKRVSIGELKESLVSEEDKEDFWKSFQLKASPIVLKDPEERVLKAKKVRKLEVVGFKTDDPFKDMLSRQINDEEIRETISFKIEADWKPTKTFIRDLVSMAKSKGVRKLKVEIQEEDTLSFVMLDLLNIRDVVDIPIKRDPVTGLIDEEELFSLLLERLEW